MMPDERPPELEIYLVSEPELPWNRAEDFIQGPPKEEANGKVQGLRGQNHLDRDAWRQIDPL